MGLCSSTIVKYRDHSWAEVNRDPLGVVWKCMRCEEIVLKVGKEPPRLQDLLSAEVNLNCDIHLVWKIMES